MEFIRGLRSRVRVGMITNAWPEVRRYLADEFKIADAFDPLVVSAEVGLAKPTRIYQLTLERLGMEPAEAVFVDDFEDDVAGAPLGGHAGGALHHGRAGHVRRAGAGPSGRRGLRPRRPQALVSDPAASCGLIRGWLGKRGRAPCHSQDGRHCRSCRKAPFACRREGRP